MGPPTTSIRLLGRTAELDALRSAVRSGLDGAFTHVQIEGEAGLGKTRLLDELTKELDGVRVGQTMCCELQRHLPYVALAAALREALAGVEIDARELPALAQILPELSLHAPRPGFDEVEVLEALVALLADHAPLVLILDDLHRADPETVAALAYARRRTTGIAVAIVTTRDVGAWGDVLRRFLRGHGCPPRASLRR